MAEETKENWYVYLLSCADGTFYCGITKEIDRRIDQHNRGTASRYTRGRGPVSLLIKSQAMTCSEALKLEARVKKTAKADKMVMISDYADPGRG